MQDAGVVKMKEEESTRRERNKGDEGGRQREGESEDRLQSFTASGL